MTELSTVTPLVSGGAVANHYASQGVFGDYLQRLSPATLTAMRYDLGHWCAFLYAGKMLADPDCADTFLTEPSAWAGVTWGQVRAYQEWLLQQGQAVSTVNRRVSTVRALCRLAALAGYLDHDQARLMESIKSISRKASRNVDSRRETTRIGNKKASTVLISRYHAGLLKTHHPETDQGVKDRLLFCLLIDLGLRAGEVVAITRADVDQQARTIRIYRQKTGHTQTLQFTRDLGLAIDTYLVRHPEGEGKLLDHSTRSLTKRVRVFGDRYGYSFLSAHDLRHYLATDLARAGLNAHQLMEAMGWQSIATAQRYIEASAIANSAAAAIIDR